jgi:23S rRNA pseudouridine955/2504/2580 synthase
MEISVIYEDDFLLAVNKPAGLSVHAQAGLVGPDLQDLLEGQGHRHWVLLHRLDRETTGLVLLAKRRAIVPAMAQAFEEHRIRKSYWAVVVGQWPKTCQRIETYIGEDRQGRWCNVAVGGKIARSTFRVLGRSADTSWLEVLPKTGRTHQIRLHCHHAGHPVLGDARYGSAQADRMMALHAHTLDFRHPATKLSVHLVAPVPDYWQSLWLSAF